MLCTAHLASPSGMSSGDAVVTGLRCRGCHSRSRGCASGCQVGGHTKKAGDAARDVNGRAFQEDTGRPLRVNAATGHQDGPGRPRKMSFCVSVNPESGIGPHLAAGADPGWPGHGGERFVLHRPGWRCYLSATGGTPPPGGCGGCITPAPLDPGHHLRLGA